MRARLVALLLAIALGAPAAAQLVLPHSDSELAAAHARVMAAAGERPDDFTAQIEAAQLLLGFADRLRNERKIRDDLDDAQDDAYRQQQAAWAERAIPWAERALELGKDDAQRAEAERTLGELYAHRITGMISGMINGPRARRHIGRALELAPDDPESQRAIGLMYLHNPPISGGDVDKAIETFERCAEAIEDDRCLVLLAMAHRKHGDAEAARAAARAALAREPGSTEAQLLLEALP